MSGTPGGEILVDDFGDAVPEIDRVVGAPILRIDLGHVGDVEAGNRGSM